MMQKEEVKRIHPVTLAFIGDAFFSLYVREKLVAQGEAKPVLYQKAAAAVVSAKGQNELLQKIEPLFSEEEADVFRRARNAKKGSKAKHASVTEYNRSTGVEAVIGYLYLTGNVKRAEELLSFADVSLSAARDAAAALKEYKP